MQPGDVTVAQETEPVRAHALGNRRIVRGRVSLASNAGDIWTASMKAAGVRRVGEEVSLLVEWQNADEGARQGTLVLRLRASDARDLFRDGLLAAGR